MTEVDFPSDHETYEQQCFRRARYYLQDKEIENAIGLLLFDKDMNPDEIKAAADLISGWESGDYESGDDE